MDNKANWIKENSKESLKCRFTLEIYSRKPCLEKQFGPCSRCKEGMNSNANSRTGITPSKCQIYTFLGGKPDQTSTAAYAADVLITVLSSIACPLTTVLNLLVIISVKRKPQLKTISNTVLGCLAVTDALMGIIGLPLFVTTRMLTYQAETSSDVCAVKGVFRSVLRILGGATMFHLIVMNVERYIAIKHPFQHITIVTKFRVFGSSALSWFAAFFTNFLLVITDYSITINVTVVNIVLLFSMAVIIYCQVVVYCETRRQEKLIAAQQVSVEAKKKFLKEKKAFKITTTVLVTLLISYLPIAVVRILSKMSVFSKNVAASLVFFSSFVFFLSSLTNPIIYCARTRQFRVAFIEILLGKTNTQAEELERRVFGSTNNNDNNNNNNNESRSHCNADNNNISNNDITECEINNNSNNNNDGNNSDDNNNNNKNDGNNSENNNVYSNINTDEIKDNNENKNKNINKSNDINSSN